VFSFRSVLRLLLGNNNCVFSFWSRRKIIHFSSSFIFRESRATPVVLFMVRSFIYPSMYSCSEWNSEWG
jgi:hypothetical protein